MRHHMTRRDALRAGSASVLSLGAASPAKAATQKAVTIGMATTRFRDYTNSRLAKELSEQGIHTIQFFLTQTDSNYWKYGGRSDLPGLTAERLKLTVGGSPSSCGPISFLSSALLIDISLSNLH